MKKLILLAIAILGLNAFAALTSIYQSPSIVEVVEATQLEVEASGEFLIHENAWVDGPGNLSCKVGVKAAEVLKAFQEFTEETQSVDMGVKLQAYKDFYSIVDNGEDYVKCSGSRSVPYYYVNYEIFYNSKYKIAFESAWED